MPRARKTQTGAKAMSVQQVPGQQYGKQVEQAALQRAMPAPQASSVASSLPQRGPADAQLPSAAPPPPAAPTTPAPADPTAAFAALRDRVGLLAPSSERPTEPLTAGLVRGEGPGPEALGMITGSPLGDTLRRLASQTGDQTFARLAQQAGL